MMNIDGSIILEGGANRGIFTAGVLDFLMEKDIFFNNIIGVSAGASNGLNYASHQIGRSKRTIMITNKKDRYIHKSKFLTSSILDMDKLFVDFPERLFPYDYNSFIKYKNDVELVATNCLTGGCEYLKIDPFKRNMESCRASCSMPLAAPVVQINSIPYVDGSVSNSIPLDRAQEKKHKIIFLVLTQKKGYVKEQAGKLSKFLIKAKYGKYPKVIEDLDNRANRYNNRLAEINRLEEEGKVFVIRPKVDTISHLEQDVKVLGDFYNHGYSLIENRFDDFLSYIKNNLN
ncbi:MAG: patatin family protein [Sphaerochaetaceae bacterium]|nr:patatin family protein [Sphaerochaetaceae bacterium]MDC7242801.1 patatin family protein [Sphaerochaetaceae bacterium]MDC7249356.1 patatin family protein [Sphaerochaetaceae bacterium]